MRVPMHILIVEDNSTNLAVLKGVVEKIEGCTVETFTDPSHALPRALEVGFDLILADQLMPGMTGAELIATLRSVPGYAEVPMIVVTADSDRATRHEAIFAGATDFLNKPIDPIELKSRVRSLLALRPGQDI